MKDETAVFEDIYAVGIRSQLEPKNGLIAGTRGDKDLSLVELNDMLDDRETKARSAE